MAVAMHADSDPDDRQLLPRVIWMCIGLGSRPECRNYAIRYAAALTVPAAEDPVKGSAGVCGAAA
jgi:hypothetical protein